MKMRSPFAYRISCAFPARFRANESDQNRLAIYGSLDSQMAATAVMFVAQWKWQIGDFRDGSFV